MTTAANSKNCGSQPGAGFCDVSIFLPPELRLDSGEELRRPEMRLRIHGDIARPIIAVAGGISAGRIVADAADGKGWWRDIVCDDGAIDLSRFCVLGFDYLPNRGEKASTISTRDQARALAHGLEVLKVERLHSFVGASYGGMVAFAFAAEFPRSIDRLCVISAADRAHPSATAIRGVQRRIIAFAIEAGAPDRGVSLARQLAMISYRTPEEFEQRFENAPGSAAGDPYDVCDYLIARGSAYGMDASRYLALSDSIDRHRVDPAGIEADTLLIGALSDRLVPIHDLRRLSEELSSAKLVEVKSLFGHDAFLKETPVIGRLIKEFIEEGVS